MKQKLLTLFTLLLTVCNGAWAEEVKPTIEGLKASNIPGVPSASLDLSSQKDFSADANGWVVFYTKGVVDSKSWWGKTQANGGSTNWTVPAGAVAPFKGGSSVNRFTLNTSRVHAIRFTAAEKFSVLGKNTVSSGTYRRVVVILYEFDGSSLSNEVVKQIGDNTDETELLFDGLSTSKNYVAYIYGNQSSNCDLLEIALKAPTTPTLTGAWKVGGETVTSGTIYQGDAVPSLSLSVDASDDSHPAAGKYNVVYSKEGDDVVEITNEGAGFTLKNNVTGTATLKATITATGNDYQDAAGTINYEYKVNPKTPTLNLDKEEVTLKSTPLARNAQTTVTLTGAFLAGVSGTVSTDGTTGLSISPEIFTISEGTVAETEFTITYNSDSGNSGDATITFTDGNINKELTVHYTSVIPHEWTTVSGTTTWDWSDITVSGDEFKLTDKTTPKKSELVSEYVVATDFDGDVYPMNVNFPEKFSSIKMSAFEYAARSANGHKIFQGTYLKLKTSVPGYISVYYLGTNTTARRININGTVCGETTEDNSTLKKAENIFVPAGEITLCGDENNKAAYLRYNKIVFTPADAIKVTTAGLATYASDYNLDFSGVTGIKAYKASISEKTITFTKMDEVPVGEGMLIRAMSDLDETTTFYVPHKASASPIDNAMKRGEGTAVAYHPSDNIYNYVLSGGSNGVGFYQANGETVPTDRAYLQSTAALAKGFVINYDDEEGEETDGIKAVSTTVENGVRYNLAGQKVGADYKGIVIVNGKKIVRK